MVLDITMKCDIMTIADAKRKYEECFGGFPEFLFRGARDDVIIAAVKKALASGEEIEAPDEDVDF